MPGYHLTEIPRGKIGDFSKIKEEFLEFCDAVEQKAHIMALVELSDLLGSIKLFLFKNGYQDQWSFIISDFIHQNECDVKDIKEKFKLIENKTIDLSNYKLFLNVVNNYVYNYNMTINDLILMSSITERVFKSGHRTSNTI